MTITGDFAKVKKWVDYVDSLAQPEFRAMVTRDTANGVRTLTAENFEKERDPFGNPWIPKKRPNGFKTLHGPDAKLRKFFIKKLTPDEFELKSLAKYFRPHQDGAKRNGTNWKLPRRQMIPEGSEVPPAMRTLFTKVYSKRAEIQKRKFGFRG